MNATRSTASPAAGPDTSQFIRGALYGAAAVSIWAGWLVVMRLGVTTTLAATDLTAIRFGTAGLILLPVLLRRGFALDRLGWAGLVALAVGGGAPFVLIVGGGLLFAPAAHAGALVPGVMPLFVALLAVAILKEPFPRAKKIGFALILCGVAVISGIAIFATGTGQTFGHLMFLCGAFLWAGYTVSMRHGRLGGLHAAAIVSVISMTVYLPVYVLFFEDGLFDAPLGDIVFQAFYQGILTMVLSLVLYGRAVSLLGASSGAAFGALGPVMAALIAIPVLGEFPAPADWAGIALVTAGVYLAGGGPLPRRASRL